MSDDPAVPCGLPAKTLVVFKGPHRIVETVAEAYKPRRFDVGLDIKHAVQIRGLFATIPTTAIRRATRAYFGSKYCALRKSIGHQRSHDDSRCLWLI